MLFRRPYQTLPMKKASLASFPPGSILIDIRDADVYKRQVSCCLVAKVILCEVSINACSATPDHGDLV